MPSEDFILNYPKVLAITKRTADLCGTQALLYAAGFGLVTATSMTGARSVMRSMPVKGVIVCRHSWNEDERKDIYSEIAALQAEATIMRCPGCSGCDEAVRTPGALCDTFALNRLIASMTNVANS